MTGIAAAVRLGSNDISDGDLTFAARGMLSAFVRRSDDGVHVWSAPGISIGQAWYATTPEDLVRGGSVAHRGPIHLVGDARVDNRDDLLESLSLPRATADLDLLGAAWEKWGSDTIRRAIGDYAIAVWDERTRELALARDGMGGRGLYFARSHRGVTLVASEIHALGVGPLGIDFDLDPLETVRFLLERYHENAQTMFAGIEAVPPGGVVRIRGTNHARARIWSPDPFARLPSGDPDACAERVGEALDLAVRSRLRAAGSVAVSLSGGLDSSSVACLAARASAGAEPPALLHFAFPGLQTDEGPFFDLVVERTRGRPVSVDPRDYARWTGPLTGRIAPGETYDSLFSNHVALFEEWPTPARGVMLTGIGGDDLQGPTGQDFPDQIMSGQLGAAWRTARTMSGGGRIDLAAFVLRAAARLAVPARVRRTIRELRPRTAAWPAWLTDTSSRALDAWHRDDISAYEAFPAPTHVQRGLALGIGGRSGIDHLCTRFDTFCRANGIDLRHPFYDRRVVEALLASPAAQRYDGTVSKGVLRRAMRGIVPEGNRCRSDVPDFTSVVLHSMNVAHRAEYLQIADQSELERAGIVRPGTLRAMLVPVASVHVIRRCISVEVALRTLRAFRATNKLPTAPSEALAVGKHPRHGGASS